MVHLREARGDECELLTELCLRSKAVWGYDAGFIAACRAELTIHPAGLARSPLRVAVTGGQITGVVQITVNGEEAELDRLFVEPLALRRGVGRVLLDWACGQAARSGARCLCIAADPGAAPFYRRMGACDDGVIASGSIPGRFLPRLRLPLSP